MSSILDAKRHCAERAEYYRKTIDSAYHRNRLAKVDTLLAYPAGTIGTCLALAHMSESDAAAFYTQIQRLLTPGGALIVTHPNELFDLFTLNKYTVATSRRTPRWTAWTRSSRILRSLSGARCRGARTP